MTNEEKLLLAIGEIDDGLISEASVAYKRRSTPLMRGLSVAASVVAVSAVVLASGALFAPKSFDKNDAAGEASPPTENASDGSDGSYVGALEGKYGFICNVVRVSEHKIMLDLQIICESTEKFDVVILGENPEKQKKAICTSGDVDDGYDLVVSPVITVNGDTADSLPTAVGAYTVVIDFSAIAETDFTWNDYIEILNFGRIER